MYYLCCKLLNMQNITYTLIFNRKGALLKNGTAQVSISIYQSGQRKYINTGVYCRLEDWNPKTKKIKNTHPQSTALNLLLSEKLQSIDNMILKMKLNNESISINSLTQYIEHETNSDDFLYYFAKEIQAAKLAEATKRTYKSTLIHLREYKNKIHFADVTKLFVKEFEKYLQRKKLGINTIGKYMKMLKAMVNRAIDDDRIKQNNNPFFNVKIKAAPTHRAHLTIEEIERLEQLDVTNYTAAAQKVRDIYLFSIYTGLRFTDIQQLTQKNIVTIEGKKYIHLTMHKTKEHIEIPIYLLFKGKAIEMLERYTPSGSGYFFNVSNQFANRILKQIAEHAGINKTITFHTARHSTAMCLLYRGVPIQVVSKILGHTKINTTEIYARMNTKIIETELMKCID